MWLVESLMAFLLSVALNVGATRIWRETPAFITFLGISALVFAGLASRYLFVVNDEPLDMVASLLFYMAATESYVLLILLVVNSVSVSILLHARARPLSPGDLDELYSGERMVEMRMARLRSMNLIEERNGEMIMTPAGYSLLRKLDAARTFFGHSASRFESVVKPE